MVPSIPAFVVMAEVGDPYAPDAAVEQSPGPVGVAAEQHLDLADVAAEQHPEPVAVGDVEEAFLCV